MPNVQLADNLRYLRKLHKLTQKELSKMLNMSRQAYSNYENKKRVPDLDTLLFLSQLYEVDLDDLVLANLRNLSHIKSGQIAEDTTPYTPAYEKKTGNTIYLDEDEINFIMEYRALTDNNKQIIAGFIKGNAKSSS